MTKAMSDCIIPWTKVSVFGSLEQPDGTVCPIVFASYSLQPRKNNCPVTDLEALAVVWSVKHIRHYLYIHTCQV